MSRYIARYQFEDIISFSKAMEETKELAARVAKSNSTVLIMGESGTGKELFAHAIHQLSARRDHPFVWVNCAAIPDELFESELFGYESGAFSGAKKEGKPGKFELANHGTIFLDEISELPYHMQGKLLRVLQEQEVERIGGVVSSMIDVRVIAATNRPLKPLIQEKKFRQDLYYRLRVFPIYIPPLRERKEDIPHLVNFFLDREGRRFGKTGVHCDEHVHCWLMRHDWTGNVRELKNWIEAAVQLVDGNVITMAAVEWLMKEETEINHVSTLKEELERTEKHVIERVLFETNGDRMAAAQRLGIHHASLYRKIAKYGLR
jgi:transcriptional regulator with PAS, ATPase and Fis domain